jgi:hypothetical protein
MITADVDHRVEHRDGAVPVHPEDEVAVEVDGGPGLEGTGEVAADPVGAGPVPAGDVEPHRRVEPADRLAGGGVGDVELEVGVLAGDQTGGEFAAAAAHPEEVLDGELDRDAVDHHLFVDPLFLVVDRVAVVVDPHRPFVGVVLLVGAIAVGVVGVVVLFEQGDGAGRQHQRQHEQAGQRRRPRLPLGSPHAHPWSPGRSG